MTDLNAQLVEALKRQPPVTENVVRFTPKPATISGALPTIGCTLATAAEPFHREGWVYEIKYDGLRVVAYKDAGAVRLIGRSGVEVTRRFPKIVAAIKAFPGDKHILDGELVTFGDDGVSKLHFVSAHGNESKAVFMLFDAPFLSGQDNRNLPLRVRREMLEDHFNRSSHPSLRLVERIHENGIKAFALAQERGLEGIVGKDEEGFYPECRYNRWLKVKTIEQDTFTVVGFTRSDKRDGFSALLVADGKKYMGRVGTGFTARDLASLGPRLEALARPTPPIPPPSPVPSGTVWTQPSIKVRVEYLPGKDHLRFPVFLSVE